MTIIATKCGRYASFLLAEAIARIFGAVNPLPNLAPSWNVAPTQSALVVRRHPGTAERHLGLLRWGLLPYWTKEPTKAQRPINARSETAAKSACSEGPWRNGAAAGGARAASERFAHTATAAQPAYHRPPGAVACQYEQVPVVP